MAPTPKKASFELAAQYLKLAGHPARLQILHRLLEGEASVTALQNHVRLTQAMTSQHLKALFISGILDRRREGTFIYYRLSSDIGKPLTECMAECSVLWSRGAGSRRPNT